MADPSKDRSVFEEPHLSGGDPVPDPGEEEAVRDVLHSVWDEPGRSEELTGAAGAKNETYQDLLEKRKRRVDYRCSWLITFSLALAAGPFAVIGALINSRQTWLDVMVIVFFGPLVEEMVKIGPALLAAETRPWYFRSKIQIMVCALFGALAFAAIENLLYLHVYHDPSPGLAEWRWTVCVALHMGCSCVAGLGVIRIWRDVWRRRARARLSLGMPYFIAAAVIHGSYNGLAVLLAVCDYSF